jgi:copper resistance protein C
MSDSLRLRGRRSLFAVAAIVVGAIAPSQVSAHSDLESSEPAEGAVLETTPSEIILTFEEALNPTRSSISLRDSTGAKLAEAHVDPENDRVMRLSPPTLQPGAYEIRWTSVAEDGDVLRGRVHFEIAAVATPSPSSSRQESPSPLPSPTGVPSPTPSESPTPTASSADVILPIVAAIVVIAILGAWLLRNRSRTSRP